MGNTKTYKTARSFKKAVEAYFDSITIRVKIKDEAGNPVTNIRGEEITVDRFAVPPSIEALSIYIGFTDRTWRNYAKGEGYEIFWPICEWASLRVKAYHVEQLSIKDRSHGHEFVLKNNFGMSDKLEVEAGPETRKQPPMSLAERMELVRLAAQHMQEDAQNEEA